MEIKRMLHDSARRITPQIEVSNTGSQIKLLAERVAELLNYAEEKEERRKLSEKEGQPFAVRVTARRDAQIRERAEAQEQATRELELEQEEENAGREFAQIEQS